MDKETYKNLDVVEQVDYINSRTKAGETVGHIARDLKIGDKTIRKKLQSAGYIYSKSNKAYIQATTQAQQTPETTPLKAIEENINAVDTLTTLELEQVRTLLQHKDALLELLNRPQTPQVHTTNLNKKNRRKATYNMDLDLVEALKNIEKGNLSVSDVVNIAVLEYLQRNST